MLRLKRMLSLVLQTRRCGRNQVSSQLSRRKQLIETYLILIADLDNNNLLAAVHEGNHCFRIWMLNIFRVV
ncbi:hypothetical protein CASFOL_026941 [Castilleja foliolosa]|uniref:Uncharacterized protein n=1 Tax=Castilleja foliolosa TaxID=1961234 RepID=A0ABD3CKH2_9LAMI